MVSNRPICLRCFAYDHHRSECKNDPVISWSKCFGLNYLRIVLGMDFLAQRHVRDLIWTELISLPVWTVVSQDHKLRDTTSMWTLHRNQSQPELTPASRSQSSMWAFSIYFSAINLSLRSRNSYVWVKYPWSEKAKKKCRCHSWSKKIGRLKLYLEPIFSKAMWFRICIGRCSFEYWKSVENITSRCHRVCLQPRPWQGIGTDHPNRETCTK